MAPADQRGAANVVVVDDAQLAEWWRDVARECAGAASLMEANARRLRSRQRRAEVQARVLAGEPEPTPTEGKKIDRILWNVRDEDIDEIVIHDALVHVEQMDTRCWWIGVYKEDGKRWSGNFVADSRGRMRFTEQDCEIEWDQDKSHDRER